MSTSDKPVYQKHDSSAEIAAKITGTVKLDNKKEPYFTNNEAIPWPDPTHCKNAGGIPVVSDTFLMQKQQTFNRSKNLERELMFKVLVDFLCDESEREC